MGKIRRIWECFIKKKRLKMIWSMEEYGNKKDAALYPFMGSR
ncbi:MAG: hypothetical protein OCU18_09215 [Candidatus Syntrophoarchaeum sp.]|nr:hypothetical protein [Candidatus Syntrophoarchaeum sp.]